MADSGIRAGKAVDEPESLCCAPARGGLEGKTMTGTHLKKAGVYLGGSPWEIWDNLSIKIYILPATDWNPLDKRIMIVNTEIKKTSE